MSANRVSRTSAPKFDKCRGGMTPTAETAKHGRAALYRNQPA